uniref:DNA-directed RNA polymerase n=1 Tax=Eutreptiella sp. CCMP389 TaxID=96781 RepID=A0A977PJE5_9EUGL|nr:RNA polymerase beta' subunit [Eutreptiella sp. CCMP389]
MIFLSIFMDFFFSNQTFDKKSVKILIFWFLINFGTCKTASLVDNLKFLGSRLSTKAGVSLGIDDLKIPFIKKRLLLNADNDTKKVEKNFLRGIITSSEKFQKFIDIWNNTNEVLTDESVKNFRQTNVLNPIYMMAFSGARGNISQVRQLVGIRGLMSDSRGEILDLPIKRNFREGLRVTEYLISCYGARKGIIDTALRTASSGYLTRKLAYVAQDIKIARVNCNTFKGILVTPVVKNKEVFLSVEKRLFGRVLAKSVLDKKNKIVACRGQDVCKFLAKKIIKNSLTKRIFIRSPLTCEMVRGVCQLCYGWNLAYGRLIEIGEAVGIIAAQSIGEPGTQLTMRTFHTGGVFCGNMIDKIYAPHKGILSYDRLSSMKQIRTKFGEKVFLNLKKLPIYIKENRFSVSKIELPAYTKIFLKPGHRVQYKQVIAEVSSFSEFFNKNSEIGSSFINLKKEMKASVEGQVYFEKELGFESKKIVLWILRGDIISFFSFACDVFCFQKKVRKKKNYFIEKRVYFSQKRQFKLFQFCNLFKIGLLFKSRSFGLDIRNFSICNILAFWGSILSLLGIESFFSFEIFNFSGFFEEECLKVDSKKRFLFYTEKNEIILRNKSFKFCIGNFIRNQENFCKFLGQIVRVQKNKIVIRNGLSNILSKNTKFFLRNRDLILKNGTLFYLFYKESKTGDIVQGLPKVEALLEARTSSGNFNLQKDNLHYRLKIFFEFYKKKYGFSLAAQKSIEKIQSFIVDSIQYVYQSQSIDISDKHIEIVVKQMTKKVVVLEKGDTDFLVGEVVNFYRIHNLNKFLVNKVKYEFLLQGITRSSLKNNSFLSASSFQETARILVQAAIQGEEDWIVGLKENIILGRLIPVGTGI